MSDFGHVVTPAQLRSFYSEKWFDIQGSTNFTVYTVNFSQKSELCRLYLSSCTNFQSLWARFMTIDEDRNKDRFKTDSFAVFERSSFVTTER